ncbi:MAG: hypothetical protein LBE06_08085 [Azoarcus sp.]|nr:hypothetical protein [Azoarcus sp.]
MKTICSLFFCALAGCMTVPPIMDAQEGVPRARLRVITDASWVNGYPGSDCHGKNVPNYGRIVLGDRKPMTEIKAYNGRDLGMPDPIRIHAVPPSNDTKGQNARGRHFAEIYIEADKPFTLKYTGMTLRSMRCNVALRFNPQENKDYEARMWLDWTQRKCFSVLTVRTDEGFWMPMPAQFANRCRGR